MCPHAVRKWLVLLTLEIYVDKFMRKGYDTIAKCQRIGARDLKKLGIYHRCHRKLLLDGVQLMNNAPERFKCSQPHHSRMLDKQETNQCGSSSSEDSSDSKGEEEVD
ncbi:uncharacterized protein LOC117589504 [Drosophila guanche]|uniref:Blast:Sterile alpha motif domain-containing protein 5 n=1 Tax=Drosophila guanche TaxID=7266 RepID=A0A3B0KMG1_DROGU|nr:uncharacterized protein LOC117589504 [Drosophila guanche]SPP87769.1 blast:Sterile alpha motif domain-containing protein 5 [Drosophila guanche]